MARFGRDAVFQDVVAIVAGESFPAAIEAALAQADVVLAVIGPRWLNDGSTEVSRLADPNDYVRRELSSALGKNKRIIPVLVGDAVMPDAECLPLELAPLADRQAVALRDDRWRADVDGLLRALTGEPAPTPRRWRWALPIVAVVVTSAAAVTGWLLLDDGRDDDGTVTEGAVAEVCPTPEGAAWTALTTTLYDGDFIEDRWSLLLRGGGYRPLADGDGWEVVLRPRLVNRGDVAVSHRNIYRFVVDNVVAEPTCFQVQSGPEIIGPGQISDALVGFKVDQEPLGTTALDADDGGQNMRVPVSVSAT